MTRVHLQDIFDLFSYLRMMNELLVFVWRRSLSLSLSGCILHTLHTLHINILIMLFLFIINTSNTKLEHVA